MMNILARLFPLLVAVVAAGCSAQPLTLEGHPLAGRVWDVAQQRFIEPAEAERRIVAADIALLGETHDNPAHHAIQARLLRQALAAGRRPALAFEQIDTEWQAAVDAARAGSTDAAAIGAAGKVAAGWQWPYYEPLVALAVEHRLPILAANISRTKTRSIAADGLASLGEGEAERIGLAAAWPSPRRAAMRQVLVDGHCGSDSPMIDKLIDVQRARDAVMADVILKAGADGVLAIIGRGHARADLGVPLYLQQRANGRRVLSLGMVEVSGDRLQPADYPDAANGTHDLLWFTPRAVRPDPCANFKRL
jgi:uncharacterized iron-regulated protein